MTSRRRTAVAVTAALACLALAAPVATQAATEEPTAGHWTEKDRKPKKHDHKGGGKGKIDKDVRFATFNASLNRNAAGQLLTDLSTSGNQQAQNAAETIQRANPDVLLVNEFDFDPNGRAAELFRDNYLEKSWNGSTPIDYPYYFVAPSNTGIPSGFDLNNNGSVGGPDDAFGFGFFPGQFGMVVYSKYPIATDDVRTFRNFLWKDMPGALLPNDPATPAPADWYSPEELAVFRLSSKSHWDVPIEVSKNKTVHFLVSHPTPPVFDAGQDDRNGKRNFDEIRFWADYISHKKRSAYIYDDEGVYGGLHRGAKFVIAGDQNSDPKDGDSIDGAIQQLLDHNRVDSRVVPESTGAVWASTTQTLGGVNADHDNPPQHDTADFAETAPPNEVPPGNLRVDYVLPSRGLKVLDSAVFWFAPGEPFYRLTGVFPFPASDHRLVWIDTRLNHRVG